MAINQQWAISIAGFGHVTSESKGLLFGEGERPPELLDWEWRTALPVAPSLSEYRLDPRTGEVRASDLNPKLMLDDDLRKRMLFQESRETGGLLAPLTATATLGRFSKLGLDGKVILVGREAIRLGSSSGDGLTYALTRGHWSSEKEAHALGTYFYDRPTFWRQRELRLWEIRDEGALVVPHGLFYLKSRPFSPDGLDCDLRCEAAFTALTKIALTPPPAVVWTDRYRTNPVTQEVYLPGFARGWTQSLWKKPGIAGSLVGVFMVDGALVHRFGTQSRLLAPLLGSDLGGESGGSVKRAKEIALWSPRAEAAALKAWTDAGFSDPGVAKIAPTSNCQWPFHPIAIMLAVCCSTNGTAEDTSTYDVMAPGRSLGMRRIMPGAKIAEAVALMSRTSHISVDQFWLGVEEGPERVFERIREMLAFYGFVMVPDQAGEMRIRRIGPGTVVDFAGAIGLLPLPDTYAQAPAETSVIDALTATVGQTPWQEGVTVSTATNSLEAGLGSLAQRMGEENKDSINAPFVDGGKAEGVARLTLVSEILYRYQGIPEITLRFDGQIITGWPWVIGDWLRPGDLRGLKADLFLTAAGELTRSFVGEEFLGQVIGVKPMPGNAGALEIRLALTNFGLRQLIRLRAPSFLVSVSLAPNSAFCAPVSAFGTALPDGEYFFAGDQVEVWGKDGTPRSTGVRTITSRSPTSLIVDDDFTSMPDTGDVLRLARASGYSNDALVSGFTRPYVYLASGGVIPGYGGRDIYG